MALTSVCTSGLLVDGLSGPGGSGVDDVLARPRMGKFGGGAGTWEKEGARQRRRERLAEKYRERLAGVLGATC